jgi:ABC-type phosphate transport system auxiliary subunit
MKDPIYDEGLSNLGIQKKTLDLTDLANLREANEAKINALNASLETSRKLKNQIEFDDRVGKEVQRRIDAEKEKAAKEAAKH